MYRFTLILVGLAVLTLGGARAETPVSDPMSAFDHLVGKTFVGDLGPDAGTDVQRWEKILGGKAVRITHSLNKGAYGGETLIYASKATGGFEFVYVTTGGFRTEGTIEMDETGNWTATEQVNGHETIQAVRSSGTLREDGTLVTSSTYLNKDGTQTPGHSFVYREDPDAKLEW